MPYLPGGILAANITSRLFRGPGAFPSGLRMHLFLARSANGFQNVILTTGTENLQPHQFDYHQLHVTITIIILTDATANVFIISITSRFTALTDIATAYQVNDMKMNITQSAILQPPPPLPSRLNPPTTVILSLPKASHAPKGQKGHAKKTTLKEWKFDPICRSPTPHPPLYTGGVGALMPPMLILRKEKEREGGAFVSGRPWNSLLEIPRMSSGGRDLSTLNRVKVTSLADRSPSSSASLSLPSASSECRRGKLTFPETKYTHN